MKRILCLFLLLFIVFTVNACKKSEPDERHSTAQISQQQQTQAEKEEKRMKLIINEKEFNVLLEENETAQVFSEALPMTVLMSELNGNEKYYYLDYSLPNNEQSVITVRKGDIMLYGDRCVVVFYKSFATAYKYTKIGHIENPDLLEEAVGNGDVSVEFTQ